MALFGFARLLLHGEPIKVKKKSTIDTAMVLWSISGIVTGTLLNSGLFAAFVNRLGVSFDSLGLYFLFRCLIQKWEDVDYAVRGFMFMSIPVAIAFWIEHETGHNSFAFLGGVPFITAVRDGRLRCQGAFAHPILAGCFWASLMPLFFARLKGVSKGRLEAIAGLTASGLIVLFCASSTPVMAIIFGIIGAYMFYLRNQMRLIRWLVLLTLVSLHIVMNKPVWHLISRIDISGGSTGWHRYNVIDAAIHHFSEWWMLGTLSTADWGVHAGDITNQYLLEGVRGGFITMGLFVVIIYLSFNAVGRLWRSVSNNHHLCVAWALGVSLFIHAMNFMAVSYFGQITMVWYLLLAMIASLDPGAVHELDRKAENC
jgi:hypothetical protein